ncbi:MAG: OmpA family protein [Sphingomicrobium sp.]
MAVTLAASVAAQPAHNAGGFVVFFDLDRADLTPDRALILDNATAAFHQAGQTQVMLTGFADRAGSAAHNLSLSNRRTQAVRAYLVSRGVPDSAIAVAARGEQGPRVGTPDGVREPQNRRVEITIGPRPAQ